MEGIINPTKAFMLRRTLLAFLLIFMFASISLSYGQTSCEAPSCSALTITGPDKVSYGESKYYTLTGGASKNIRWSVDNPNASISGDNKGATLTIGKACDCNNGAITITAKDTATGCSGTFRVQAGTWVTVFSCYVDAYYGPDCNQPGGWKTVGRRRYQYSDRLCCTDCNMTGDCQPGQDYCWKGSQRIACWDAYIAAGGIEICPPLQWRDCDNPADCQCLWTGYPCYDAIAYGYIQEWKCPAPSQTCSTTCSLSITDFKTSAATFDPYSETACLSGLVDENTGKSIGWKIEVKDDTGKVVKQFGGGTSYVAASWNGRDDNGEVVSDGIYKALLTAKTGDGKCTAKRELDVTVQTECRFTISTDPKEVWPQIPATQRPTAYTEDWTKAKILVSLTKPAPLGGCPIDFTVEPVEYTGGHDHSGGRPKGKVEPANITIPYGTEGIVKAAVYTSNEVSGEEKIIAKMKDKDGNEKTIDEEKIKVKVPGLGPLSVGTNLITWTSTEKYHKLANSNYGTSATIGNVQYVVGKYVEDYELIPTVKLAVVDMSLPWGGLFDVDGNWSPSHGYHRVGKSVDFSKYYRDDKGNVISVGFFSDDGDLLIIDNLIDQDELDRNFGKKKCARWEKRIGKIHYECKQ